MIVRSLCCSWFFLLWLGFTSELYAEDIESLLRRHIEARGGIEAIQAIKTLSADGVIEALGRTTSFRVRRMRPNSIHIEMDFDEGLMTQAYDGTEAWVIDSLSGESEPKLMGEGAATSLIAQSALDGVLVQHVALGAQVEFAGREQLDGENMWRLEILFAAGDRQTIFLGAEDYLVRQKRVSRKRGNVTFEVATTFSDYRQVEGVQMAHRVISQTIVNQWLNATTRSSDRRPPVFTRFAHIEAGTKIDPKIFRLPPTRQRKAYSIPE